MQIQIDPGQTHHIRGNIIAGKIPNDSVHVLGIQCGIAVFVPVFPSDIVVCADQEAGGAAGRVYKDAVFDTNRKSLLRHISAEKGLK